MPLDAAAPSGRIVITYRHDDLSDIDKTKPLSVDYVRRIVRSARRAGEIPLDVNDMDMALARRGYAVLRAPHVAVDDFLGAERERSCPCQMPGEAGVFLDQLTKMHFTAFKYCCSRNGRAPNEGHARHLKAQFEAMLIDG
jgi:hypothetical protein